MSAAVLVYFSEYRTCLRGIERAMPQLSFETNPMDYVMAMDVCRGE